MARLRTTTGAAFTDDTVLNHVVFKPYAEYSYCIFVQILYEKFPSRLIP